MKFTIDENTGAVVPRGTAQMGVERQIPEDLQFWYKGLLADKQEYFNAPVAAVRNLIERIADHAAEVERLQDVGERAAREIVGCFEVAPSRGSHYANSVTQTIAIIIQQQIKAALRTDQQLQPKGEPAHG